MQMCLEKAQKFWKNQGKFREFHQEQNVETMCEDMLSLEGGVNVMADSCLCSLVVMTLAQNARDWSLIPC